jgi:hypothetical protein
MDWTVHRCTLATCCIPRPFFERRMVHIKHTAHLRVLPETAPMSSDDETEVPSQQIEVSRDASSSWSLDDSDDC